MIFSLSPALFRSARFFIIFISQSAATIHRQTFRKKGISVWNTRDGHSSVRNIRRMGSVDKDGEKINIFSSQNEHRKII